MLKSIMDTTSSDYISIFLPFLGTIFSKEGIVEIDAEKIPQLFNDHYGLSIPYSAVITILNRARKKGLINKSDTKYFVNQKQLNNFDITLNTDKFIGKQERIIDFFIKYCNTTFKKKINKTEGFNSFINFLNKHNVDLLFYDLKKERILPKVPEKKESIYLVGQFINYCSEKNRTLFEEIIDVTLGHIIANSLFFPDPTQIGTSLKNVNIYFDTPFIFKLLGLEGELKSKNMQTLIELLKTSNATLYLFPHTKEEILGILTDCVRWLESPNYDPKYASPVLLHFVENEYTITDVELFISQFDEKLNSFSISVSDTIDINKFQQYEIDVVKLKELISKAYKFNNSTYEHWKKERVIDKDIQSISCINKSRKGNRPYTLKSSKAIFITTNTGLASACREYEFRADDTNIVYSCVTDVYIGTILWLQSPTNFINKNLMKLIAFSYAAIEPDSKLMNKYYTEINKLKDNGKVTESEYYFLRSNRLAIQLLEEKTLNDPDQFKHNFPLEILASFKNEIVKPYESNILELKKKSSKQREEIKAKNDVLKKISIYIYRFTGIVISMIATSLVYLSINYVVAQIILSIITAGSFISGFTLRRVSKKFIKLIYRKLLRLASGK